MTLATVDHTPRLQAHTITEAMSYAQALAQSGVIPDKFRQQPANVLVAQEIASALQESTWVVMSEMSFVSGKPCFSAKFMRSRIRQAGHKLRESYDKTTGTARAVIIRSDDPDFEHFAEWDEAKARQHDLWGKSHWKKNPELMLKNRAVSECMREACYEVMNGMPYTPDEIQDFAPEPVRQSASRQHRTTQGTASSSTQAPPAPQGVSRTNDAVAEVAAALGGTVLPQAPQAETPTAPALLPVDNENYPLPVDTDNPEEDLRLDSLITLVRAQETHQELQNMDATHSHTFTQVHHQAFIMALEARLAQINQPAPA